MNSKTRGVWTQNLLYFTFVGGVGFIIDGGLLTIFSQFYELNMFLSRLISFSIATVTTWGLNRTLVFNHDVNPAIQKSVEYGRYLIVQVCGALFNLFVFTLAITTYPPMKAYPIGPLFIGAIFGLFINFTGSRYFVFRKG